MKEINVLLNEQDVLILNDAMHTYVNIVRETKFEKPDMEYLDWLCAIRDLKKKVENVRKEIRE